MSLLEALNAHVPAKLALVWALARAGIRNARITASERNWRTLLFIVIFFSSINNRHLTKVIYSLITLIFFLTLFNNSLCPVKPGTVGFTGELLLLNNVKYWKIIKYRS
jgi:hypothetical protein